MEMILVSPEDLKVIIDNRLNVAFQKYLATVPNLDILPIPQKKYLTRKEAAKRLGVSLVTLNTWTKEGVVKGYRISSRVRYLEGEIDQALVSIKTS